MTHPRLSVSEMCTYPWPFADELALWDELGVCRVGLIGAKVDQHGRDAATAALRDRSMVATTIITSNFDLSAPATWDATRANINDTVDLAAVVGGCTYFTPGRRDGRSFDELAASLADAVAPCVEYAAAKGVRLAIEPSLRTDQSFVHTLRDGLDVAEPRRYRDHRRPRELLDRARLRGHRPSSRGPHRNACSSPTRSSARPKSHHPAGAPYPATATLPIAGFFRAALDAGYTGAFELEMVGPKIEAEGHASATRRAVEQASALLQEVLS